MRLLACLFAALLVQDARTPEPDADAQKAAVKQLKETFKDEYAKKAAAEQVDLARKLIKTSAETGVDANTRYACLTEARDLAVSAGDSAVAMEAVALIGKSFTIAIPAAKMAALAKLEKTAKDPEKARALAKGYYDLVKEGVTCEEYETSSVAAGKAETLARAVKDANLAERVVELKKDLATLKAEYGKVKAAIDNPAGGDLDAVGRYMCFVRNEWPTGLKILSESGKTPLNEMAGKDLANPPGVEAQAELGDYWYSIAQAEKVAWKKQNILSRARYWYEQALPASTGLVKVRLTKRMGDLENAAPGGGIHLLPLIDPKKDAVHGEWSVVDGVLTDKGSESLSLQIPYEPPDEYDFHVAVKRQGAGDSCALGIVVNNSQVTVLIDGYPDGALSLTGFETVDGKYLNAQPNALKVKPFIGSDKPASIDVAVRKTSITVAVDGAKILTYSGPMSKLSGRADSKTPNEKTLYVGGWNGKMLFSEIRVTPLSGPGKKLR